MNQPQTDENRLQKVDIFRGLALVGMVIYHFSWDLSYFSYIPPELPASGVLRILARLVAFCFLFTAGFSLYLAHAKKLRWHAYFHRLLIIILAACLVSLVSYFAMPQGFIYFGILHEIALTSIIALLFLHTPIFLNLIAIVTVFLAPYAFTSDIFNAPYLLWIGLSTFPRPSFDYVPVFPWFSAGLIGLTTARVVDLFHGMSALKQGIRPHFLDTILQLMGRHSLIFYLVHQPVLLTILYCITLIFPPSLHALRAPMENACVVECQKTQPDSNLCRDFCGCVFDEIEAQNLIAQFSKSEISQDDDRLQKPVNACWGKIIGKLQTN